MSAVAAVLRLGVLVLLADVDDAGAALAHRRQHPRDVVAVGVDRVGEVEAAAAALRAR